jgi:hypothetical protein
MLATAQLKQALEIEEAGFGIFGTCRGKEPDFNTIINSAILNSSTIVNLLQEASLQIHESIQNNINNGKTFLMPSGLGCLCCPERLGDRATWCMGQWRKNKVCLLPSAVIEYSEQRLRWRWGEKIR